MLVNACAVQITSVTDHMEHGTGAKAFRKGTHIHQESMTTTSPRKDIEKSSPRLENIVHLAYSFWLTNTLNMLGLLTHRTGYQIKANRHDCR